MDTGRNIYSKRWWWCLKLAGEVYKILIVMNVFKEFLVCETSQVVIHKENESEEPLLERKSIAPGIC